VSEILREIVQQLKEHETLLSQLIVVPHPTFPIHTQYAVIEQLLRTSLSLPVQEWIESGQEYAKEATNTELLSDPDRRKLWEDAAQLALTEARKQKWGADYTLAEAQDGVENIQTGLQRELVVPDLEEDDDDYDFEDQDGDGDDSMDVDGPAAEAGAREAENVAAVPPLSLDVLMKFMSTGNEV
jgi:hypothetical protein